MSDQDMTIKIDSLTQSPRKEMSELMKAHLDAIAGGGTSHSSWRSVVKPTQP